LIQHEEKLEGDAVIDEHEQAKDKAGETSRETKKERASQERKLDKAIADSFPASDPIAPSHPTGEHDDTRARVDRKTPPLDVELVKELARNLKRETGT
jgi:hypothetical protein